MDGKDVILMAEDDQHDVLATQRAWKKYNIDTPLKVVRNGEECLDYLCRRGKYADPQSSPFPKVLLLDLNMPKVGGLEVLETMHADERLHKLPVVVLTTSDNEPDLQKCYALGANAYIAKPVDFGKFAEAINKINLFWRLVTVPQ